MEINNISLLKNTLDLINLLGIKNILINTFYLSDQIEKYIRSENIKLTIVKDGSNILNTGGVYLI